MVQQSQQLTSEVPQEILTRLASPDRVQTLIKLRRLLERTERRYAPTGRLLDGAHWMEPLGAASAPEAGVLPEHDATRWWTGAGPIDRLLAPYGLARAGVHEIKPDATCDDAAWASRQVAALGFAFALAATNPAQGRVAGTPEIVCCMTRAQIQDVGRVYPRGLHAYGLDAGRLIFVDATRDSDVLWAAEECLRSSALNLVIAAVHDVALTPARRLALSAAETGTPCVMLTDPRAPPMAAVQSRWAVAPIPGGDHRFDPAAPGPRRFSARLARLRSRPLAGYPGPFALEWCDETFRFRLAPGIRDRAVAPPGQAHAQRGGIVRLRPAA